MLVNVFDVRSKQATLPRTEQYHLPILHHGVLSKFRIHAVHVRNRHISNKIELHRFRV